nr:dienelactone hydrolase family protein [uncultured Flavobacterium sp.]
MKNVVTAGTPLAEAEKALVMIHGRGASAQDILSLSKHLTVDGFALLAPQAAGHTWYPLSFLAVPQDNEPYLSASLNAIAEVVSEIETAGISRENIYFLGFSQGACLSLEFVTRNASKFGGVAAFTGGLIGDRIYAENYNGNFDGTPVFIGTSNPDFHVPVQRVYDTETILNSMNANVTVKVYDNMPHTIVQDEIDLTNQLVFKI